MSEQPFFISVSDEELAQLQARLKLTRLPDEIDEAGRDYGEPLADIRRLVTRWQNGYDWRVHEAALNAELPQFTRDIEIDGFSAMNIHYVHKKSTVQGAIPLLFVHGWPGSFIEVRKILPLLTAASPEHPSFHVVALDLPNYGFSEGPKKRGFDLSKYGEVAHKLMLALGYDEYVTQGGDWGSIITLLIAYKYGGKYIKAYHSNMPIAHPDLSLPTTAYTPAEQQRLGGLEDYRNKEFGYFKIQASKPQTLAYSLSDSPVGLLAWIHEKLVTWGNDYVWDDDEVLTWVSIYWFSRAGPGASVRTYYETTNGGIIPLPAIPKEPLSVPIGYSFFVGELMRPPRAWYLKNGNVVLEGDHDEGGHFAAYQTPKLLSGDLFAMFGKNGGAYGVVEGKTGF
ncbi:alpha/beta-hydrolase [Fistulina hepatica ATCC 64428]|uniref:Alpha/beta-hydrolase n=1 Tax=Fistulina hepatica ATCC 64428 TaxID=1128425 RepID=A0A0D7AH38_9AGAR|nr:alpha/beta-hydrolase [Fistulina hepatica ATCC 64428]